MVEEEIRYKILAFQLMDFSREHDYSLDEFKSALAYLFGWSCAGESESFKKVMLVIIEQAMKDPSIKY